MRVSAIIILMLAALAGLFGLGYCEEPPKMAISSESEAIAQVLAYTGFDRLEGYEATEKNVSASLMKMDQVKIPFLWRRFADKPIWVVEFRNVELYDERVGIKDPHVRTFIAYLDPDSGYLLRLQSKLDSATDYNQEPPVEEIEEQLRLNEKFAGFPDSLPKIDFLDALQRTGPVFREAQEIIAFYVSDPVRGSNTDTTDVWSIDLRGFSVDRIIGPHSPMIPEYLRGHERFLIDANTGFVYAQKSTPVTVPPEILEKYKKKAPGQSDQGILQDHDVDSITYAQPLETAEEARQAADRYTGFDKVDSTGERKLPTVRSVPIDSLEIPFLTDKTRAGDAWVVTYASIPVGQGTRRVRNREFSVFLDKATGKLLMIYSIADDAGSSDTIPQLSAKAAEESFEKSRTSFRQLPDQLPKVPFWNALDSVFIAHPATCKIIKGYYWDFNIETAQLTHCWRIIMRGIESPMPASHGANAGNNAIVAIDGDTGRPLFATNVVND
jgi:hypothetical protein